MAGLAHGTSRRRLRATLSVLEKLTLSPDDLSRADADAARDAGVGTDALVDAIHIGSLSPSVP